MADTFTPNYHLTKPDPGSSPTTWGVKVNLDLDSIDGQLFTATTNAAAALGSAAQIGMVVLFAGGTIPTNWLLCDGTVYPVASVPKLVPILGNRFGGVSGVSCAVPDLRAAFAVGAGTGHGGSIPLGTTGGEATHALTTPELAAHSHIVNDPTHAHVVSDPQHRHSIGTQIYGLGSGGNNITAFSGSGGPGGTDYSPTGVTIQAAATGVTIQNSGSGTAHNNMPPYVALYYIIKYQ